MKTLLLLFTQLAFLEVDFNTVKHNLQIPAEIGFVCYVLQ